VTDAAHVLGVTRPALSALLNERAHLSPEMALRIEKAFGVSMDTLMRMQNSYDIVTWSPDCYHPEVRVPLGFSGHRIDWRPALRSSEAN